MENPGRVFTRDQLLEMIWGADYIGETRTVDVHIGTLRTKLGEYGNYIDKSMITPPQQDRSALKG